MPQIDQRCRDLLKIGDALFSRKEPLHMFWQEIAEHYYYARADFTVSPNIGDDWAAGSMSTYPYLARQELGNLLSSMLRSGEWFGIHVTDQKVDEAQPTRKWLEWATGVQRNAMRDRLAAFARATREADHDFVSFGNLVICLEIDKSKPPEIGPHLLYRAKHLRDCAWTENWSGQVDAMHEKWKPTARLLKQRFKEVHSDVTRLAKEDPEKEITCRRIVVPREDFDYGGKKSPKARFQSIYVDVEHEFELESTPVGWFPYIVSRFATCGTQYGYSPCVVVPDARSAQTIRRVLLEAGEKAIDPPMIGAREVFRSDIPIYAGAFTFADLEADQRLGDVFQQLIGDKAGLGFGMELEKEIKTTIANSFFLNKITLNPDMSKVKTAYEARKIVEEHLRSSTPMWEPVEQEYSAQLCGTTFEALRWENTFGAYEKWPEQLQNRDIEFQFQNPLKEMANEMKGQRFMEGLQLTEAATQLDPAQAANINPTKSFRDALRGIGWPADWLADEEAVEQARQDLQARQQAQEGAAALGTGAQIAEQGGKAAQALQQAGVM